MEKKEANEEKDREVEAKKKQDERIRRINDELEKAKTTI